MNFIIIIATGIVLLAIILIVGSIFIFFAIWEICINVKTGVPWVKTPVQNLNKIFAEINLPKNSLIYDLGCGDGRALFLAEKLGLRAHGYELSLYPFLKCFIKKVINNSNIIVKRKDFLKQDLKDAKAIFLFLSKAIMNKTGNKLKNNLKQGTLVISYGFKLPGWNIEKILNTKPSKTYFYKV